MSTKEHLSRRRFLKWAGAGTTLLLAACQPKVVEKVVKETVVVKEQVEKQVTTVVEKEKLVQQTVVVAATKAPEQKITLRVMTNQQAQYAGAFKYAMDKDVLGWKSQHPNITVNIEGVPGWSADFFAKLMTLTASGTLGDIVWSPPRHRNHIGWGTQYKIVIDLMPIVQAKNYDLKQFYPGVVAAATHQGKFYFMPLTSEPVVPFLAYNQDLVDKWKLPQPTDDMVFEDLIPLGQQGTREGVWGYHIGSESMHPLAWGPGMRQRGLEWLSEDGKKAFPQANAKEILMQGMQFDYDLIYKHKTMPAPDPSFVVNDVFIAGKIVAYNVWPVYINYLPTVCKFNVQFVYRPIDKKGAKRRSMLNEHVHGVTTSSKSPQEAFDLLSLIASEELCVQYLLTGSGAPVGRPDLYEDQRALKLYPGLSKLKAIMAEIEPDFFVQNYRGEEFDKAFNDTCTQLQLDKLTVAQTADKVMADCQAVVAKPPA